MAITDQITVASFTTRGSTIDARNLGMNLAQAYERFGSLPWEKLDEVQAEVGAQVLRFPGGTEAETLFDYAHPQATTAVAPWGDIMQLTTPQAFLDYCGQTGTTATFVLATQTLLTEGAYGTRQFDSAQTAAVRAYVAYLLNEAGPGGIATFELGNEYASYMNAVEYGKVASTLALIVDQEIDRYYTTHSGTRPDIAVQVWGVSAGEGLSLSDLAARNQTVLAQFSASELAAITATTTHYYYTEGKFSGDLNAMTYDNLGASLGASIKMMQAWDRATGRALDMVFSEWNVHFKDQASFGLQQAPILLEMFQTLMAAGVDEMDIWSSMYNASALADYRAQLQTSGLVMQVLAHEAMGMKVADVPVASHDYDIHGFTNGSKTLLFVSSMVGTGLHLSMDLGNYLDRYELASLRVIGVDASGADGVYKTWTGLAPWEEPDAPVQITQEDVGGLMSGDVLEAQLAAHETLILTLERAPIRLGSMRADTMTGGALEGDRIDAMAANDRVWGQGGDDTLFGGDGADRLWGGADRDRLWGGLGSDAMAGGTGNDTLEGRNDRDWVNGEAGNDYLAGGDASDQLTGGAGADAFVFRSGETGTDTIRDFHVWERDILLYEGLGAVDAHDFALERRAMAGIGSGAAELLVHWGSTHGPVLAILQDCGSLSSVTMQDAVSGLTFALH